MVDKLYKSKEWLDNQINVLGKTQAQVARECGVCIQTVNYWWLNGERFQTRDFVRKEKKRLKILENKPKNKEYLKIYYNCNKDILRKNQKEYRKNLKIQAMETLGGCRCVVCGDVDLSHLTIDHIDNTGSLDREKWSSGDIFYRALINKKYPKEKLLNLRVLCWNHNCERTRGYLKIPHEEQSYRQRYRTMRWKEARDFFGPCPCGNTNLEQLTISHIHDDGARRRRGGERMGVDLINDFHKMGWPESLKEDFLLECFNCNCSRYYFSR